MKEQLSTQDIQTLSAYLDGKLAPREKAHFESRLVQQASLQEELEAIKQTRLMLQKTPKRRAPHNFTLSPAMAPHRPAQPLFPVFRFATALAGVLLIATFAAQFLLGSEAPVMQTAAPLALSAASNKVASTEPASLYQAPAAVSRSTPTGLATTPLSPGSGLGGGSPALPKTSTQLNAVNPLVAETATETAQQKNQSLAAVGIAKTPTPLAQNGQPATTNQAEGSGTPAPSATEIPPSNPLPPAVSDHQNTSGPVLGIQPPATPEVSSPTSAPIKSSAPSPQSFWTWGESSLLFILVGMAAAAIYFYRKEKL